MKVPEFSHEIASMVVDLSIVFCNCLPEGKFFARFLVAIDARMCTRIDAALEFDLSVVGDFLDLSF